MSRLFLKFFAFFWLATVVIVAGAAWLNLWIAENYGDDAVPERVRTRLEETVERIASRIEAGYPPMPARPGPGPHMVHVIDETGRDLNPRPLPRRLGHLSEHGTPPNRADGPGYRAVTAVNPGGESFRIIAAIPLPPQILAGGRRGALLRLAVAIVVSAVACWLLAYFLTRPVRRLRWAAAALGEGRLNQRVRDLGSYSADEIGDLARDFDRMADRLEEARRAQEQLLRDVSHELRSPLARLQVALELARERAGDIAAREFDRMEHEAERLSRLIGDILVLSRRASQQPTLKTVSLNAILEKVVADAAYEARPAGKQVNLAAEADVEIRGDERLLLQALENVVRNALAHSPEGGVVSVTLTVERTRAKVAVCDRGPGVPPEELERIFRPFHRLGAGSGNHGVGLAIVKATIQAHGGNVKAVNRPGGGLCVQIDLDVTGDEKESTPD